MTSQDATALNRETLPFATVGAVPDRVLAKTVLWTDTFDGPVADDWTLADDGRETAGVAAGPWIGWTRTTRDEWVDAFHGDQRRTFTRASRGLMVVEGSPSRPRRGQRAWRADLISPSVPLAPGARCELAFDSHYRGGRGPAPLVFIRFDTGERRDLLSYRHLLPDPSDGRRRVVSRRERLRFQVPADAHAAVVTWRCPATATLRYWAIDNVEVSEPLPDLAPGTLPLVTVDTISDIQGAKGNRRLPAVISGLRALHRAEPARSDAHALVLNGDLVPFSSQHSWRALQEALNQVPYDGQVLATPGNHDFYGFAPQGTKRRFLEQRALIQGEDPQLAGFDDVWQEYVIDGTWPIIMVGSEHYNMIARRAGGPFVTFSRRQLDWLDARLSHWEARGVPVLLHSHQVLPNSVGGTYTTFSRRDYGPHEEEFVAILSAHRHLVLYTSHTHWPITSNDWAVQYRAGAVHPIPVVSTGAITTAYGPSGNTGESPLPGEHTSGVRTKIYDDRVRVEAWSFAAAEPRLIRRVDFPRAL